MKLKHLHYGWVMVVMGIFALGTYGVMVYTFGIFLTPLTTEFNWDRGAISGAYSVKVFVMGLLAILTGRISDKYKYGLRLLVTTAGLTEGLGFLLMSRVSSLWQVYVIWGIMGLAASCCFIPVTSTIARWFTEKRGMAIGLTVTGFGLSGIVAPLLAEWLISSYGWRQAYVILGIMSFMLLIPLAQFMKHSPQRVGLKPYGESEATDKQSPASVAEGLSFVQAIKAGRFWIFGFVQVAFGFSFHLILIHIVSHAVDTGISAMVAASIWSIVAAASIIGRFSTGFISDKVGARPLLTACLGSLALALILLLFTKELWMFYVFAVIFGVAYGGMVPLFTLAPAELFGLSSLGTIIATLMFCGNTGGMIGPPVGGSIFDVTGSYSAAFLICITLCALAFVLSFILLRSKYKEGMVVPE